MGVKKQRIKCWVQNRLALEQNMEKIFPYKQVSEFYFEPITPLCMYCEWLKYLHPTDIVDKYYEHQSLHLCIVRAHPVTSEHPFTLFSYFYIKECRFYI